jgi:hypothetical protein
VILPSTCTLCIPGFQKTYPGILSKVPHDEPSKVSMVSTRTTRALRSVRQRDTSVPRANGERLLFPASIPRKPLFCYNFAFA